MKITYRKKIINEIKNKEELEKFIIENNIYKNFRNLSYFDDCVINKLITEHEILGIKAFKNKFLRKLINDKNRFSKNFWLLRGFNEKETIKIISELQQTTSQVSVKKLKKLKNENESEWAKKKNTRIEYWIEKCGGDVDKARKLYFDRQQTFTLNKCIIKHGEEKGKKIFKQRQEKWINSLYSNYDTKEKRDKFHKSRAITLKKCIERHGEEKGKKIYENYIIKHNVLTIGSQWSYKIINKLEKKFKLNGYYKSENNKEYFLRTNKNIYFYDYCVPELNFIIEFNGEHVHPNKEKLNETEWLKWKQCWTNKSSDECYKYDCDKNDLVIKNDFDLLIVWYNDKKALDKCIKFIKNKIDDRNRN